MKTMEKSDAMRIKTSLRASLSLFLTLSLSLSLPLTVEGKERDFLSKQQKQQNNSGMHTIDSFSGGEFL
jgi:recombinational DNA repair protein RecT